MSEKKEATPNSRGDRKPERVDGPSGLARLRAFTKSMLGVSKTEIVVKLSEEGDQRVKRGVG